ncbi:hypothetical protein CEV34_4318 [Brucella pseudogrignonensis]|uniref:Uncharacterized protein n=1 Tax=Brucella pseudogrignonensis TaxID=419475 RepID=A0A256G6A0_9HYPH|nr:hypothetical protein CEV34_4318 [Brucella pseudogrignonensis]
MRNSPSFGKDRKTFAGGKKREAEFRQGSMRAHRRVRRVATSGVAIALKGFF